MEDQPKSPDIEASIEPEVLLELGGVVIELSGYRISKEQLQAIVENDDLPPAA